MFAIMFAFTALSVPLMPVIDWIAPWDEAVTMLEENEVSGIRLMVGFSGSYQASLNDGSSQSNSSRSFMMIPQVFSDAKAYTAFRNSEGDVEIYTHENGAFNYLLMYAILGLITRFFTLPRIVQLFIKVGKVERDGADKDHQSHGNGV